MFTLLVPAAAGLAACRAPRPVASREVVDVGVQVSVTPPRAPAGHPLAVRYEWRVGPTFRNEARPYRAFAHFVTSDATILVLDDHVPDPDPRTWQPGTTYTETHVLFPPRQFPGPLRVHVGLLDPDTGRRAVLRGQDVHETSYVAASIALDRHAPLETRFFSGFSAPWSDAERPFDVSRWMYRQGVVSCGNPRADAVFFLSGQAHVPAARLRMVAGRSAYQYTSRNAVPFTIAARLSREALGDEAWTDISWTVDGVDEGMGGRRESLLIEHAALVPAADVAPEVLDAVTVLADDSAATSP